MNGDEIRIPGNRFQRVFHRKKSLRAPFDDLNAVKRKIGGESALDFRAIFRRHDQNLLRDVAAPRK